MSRAPAHALNGAASRPIHWLLGEMEIGFGRQAPSDGPARGAELLIPVGQPLVLHQLQLEQILRPGTDLLYLPAQAGDVRHTLCQGWRLTLDPLRLSLMAAELSAHRLRPSRFLHRLSRALVVQAGEPRERELIASLRQLLEQVAAASEEGRRQLELAGLDRCIQRLVVLLLCDELLAARQEATNPAGQDREQVFGDLLDWIRANLHRTIRLEDLERQSCYSQRSLRNFFQEHFECGPVQWIRSQRLEGSRARLLQPQPGDSVSAIAAAFGYLSLAQFSRDFQRTFHTKPSALLREGLRGRNASGDEPPPPNDAPAAPCGCSHDQAPSQDSAPVNGMPPTRLVRQRR